MSDSSYERDRFFIVFRLPSGNDCINLNDPLSGSFLPYRRSLWPALFAVCLEYGFFIREPVYLFV